MIEPIRWRDERLYILDQTLLPIELLEIELNSVEGVWEAIKALRVRGAPAIGVAAAFGLVVALNEKKPATLADARRVLEEAAEYLATSRPTAVNLFWALDRMRAAATAYTDARDAAALRQRLIDEAVEIFEEDKRCCRAIGDHGAVVIPEGGGVLTHCNAGSLATSAYGTALAVMFRAHEQGRHFRAYADETRPLLQGSRLTVYELMEAGIPTTLICDNTAAQVMKEGRIDVVVVGSDRIASNGDIANKIGTYNVALIAKAHNIPVYVAAPLSTVDMSIASGDDIPIEERAAEEVTHGFGKPTAPLGVEVYSPAFDVTPARLIAGIITERGILRPPYTVSLAACFKA